MAINTLVNNMQTNNKGQYLITNLILNDRLNIFAYCKYFKYFFYFKHYNKDQQWSQ